MRLTFTMEQYCVSEFILSFFLFLQERRLVGLDYITRNGTEVRYLQFLSCEMLKLWENNEKVSFIILT